MTGASVGAVTGASVGAMTGASVGISASALPAPQIGNSVPPHPVQTSPEICKSLRLLPMTHGNSPAPFAKPIFEKPSGHTSAAQTITPLPSAHGTCPSTTAKRIDVEDKTKRRREFNDGESTFMIDLVVLCIVCVCVCVRERERERDRNEKYFYINVKGKSRREDHKRFSTSGRHSNLDCHVATSERTHALTMVKAKTKRLTVNDIFCLSITTCVLRSTINLAFVGWPKFVHVTNCDKR